MPKSIGEPLPPDAYARAGVDSVAEEQGMAGLARQVTETFAFRAGVGRPALPLGYFANVVDLGNGQGLALSTDGVGTKLLVAEMLGRYDTVGIDCVAMNVNDVLCVGAEPIAMLDYVAVQKLEPDRLTELARGLREGARQARVAIPGGEIAQVPEMVRGIREGNGLDLVGTCVGTVAMDRILIGQQVAPGDVVVGLRSSGIHSNGLSLARDVLFRQAGLDVEQVVAPLEHSIGEELLVPTRIYVAPALAMLEQLAVKAFIHVTSDGLLNLLRIASDVGFELDHLPEPPPIFRLIARLGQVPAAQMYAVFNMGIGFCAILPEAQANRAIAIAREHGVEAMVLGRAVAEPRRAVRLLPIGLEGRGSEFHSV